MAEPPIRTKLRMPVDQNNALLFGQAFAVFLGFFEALMLFNAFGENDAAFGFAFIATFFLGIPCYFASTALLVRGMKRWNEDERRHVPGQTSRARLYAQSMMRRLTWAGGLSLAAAAGLGVGAGSVKPGIALGVMGISFLAFLLPFYPSARDGRGFFAPEDPERDLRGLMERPGRGLF